jgi:large subunit ribosomal protein L47
MFYGLLCRFIQSFDDLHKLWYVLYKERNVLLTSRLKIKRNQNITTTQDENRYIKVKRSMAAIKLVLDERKKIDAILHQSEPNL